MDMKKYCEENSNAEPALIDVPLVYLPCPHRSYKSKVINRATLTHDQYIDLLSTPRGFTWSKHTGLATPMKKKGCSVIRRDDNMGGIKAPLRTTDYRYLRDFITDVWNVMTPEYEKRLKKILMKEYGMSESQAKEFLEEQRLRSAFSQRKPHTRINLSARHNWVKEIADVISGKLTDYLTGMLAAKRTRRVRFTAEAILKSLGEMTGEKCPLREPQNRVQNAQVFIADRLAIWLSNIFGDYDQELCRLILKITDDAERDSEASSESESELESDYEYAAQEAKGQTPAEAAAPGKEAGETKLQKEPSVPTGAKIPSEVMGTKVPSENKPQNEPSETEPTKGPTEALQKDILQNETPKTQGDPSIADLLNETPKTQGDPSIADLQNETPKTQGDPSIADLQGGLAGTSPPEESPQTNSPEAERKSGGNAMPKEKKTSKLPSTELDYEPN